MAEATLEERVATLEQLVARLLRTTAQGEPPKDWRRTVGMFDGDPVIQVRDAPAAFALHARLEATPDEVVTTVITLEEQMRRW